MFVLGLLQSMLHFFSKRAECSRNNANNDVSLTTYQNNVLLFSMIGLLLFLISLRGLCNFVPWLKFDWILYKIGFFIYIIQTSVSSSSGLVSPIGGVGETFFILCSFNALYQYLYFPDTKGDDDKLKHLSQFGDVLKSEYYLTKLQNL
jgi:hypothetical protein